LIIFSKDSLSFHIAPITENINDIFKIDFELKFIPHPFEFLEEDLNSSGSVDLY